MANAPTGAHSGLSQSLPPVMLHGNKICVEDAIKRLTAGFFCVMVLFALQKFLLGQRVFP
jgi:hypothetical protein